MSSFGFVLVCIQACLVQYSLGACIGNGLGPGYGAVAGPVPAAASLGRAGSCSLSNAGLAVPIGAGSLAGPTNFASQAAYGGSGIGNVAIDGELPVRGKTALSGHVPIIGAVQFAGPVYAAGTVSIVGRCDCGCGSGSYGY